NGVPACSGRRCPYDSDTNPDLDTDTVYRPAGTSVKSKMPESSVSTPRPPGSSAALMKTRARLTGRPLSPATTCPVIRPVGVGSAVSCGRADVSRAGCCDEGLGCGGGGGCAATPAARPARQSDVATQRMAFLIRQDSRPSG